MNNNERSSACRIGTRFPAICLSALLLAACGGGVEGEYFWGEEGQGVTLELMGDDVATITLTGLPPVGGTYKVDGDQVTVVMNGDIDVYRIEDGNLTGSGFGETVIFVKQ